MEEYIEKVISAKCSCHCGILEISEDSDGDIDINYYVNGFYSKSDGVFKIIWNRIKSAYLMLAGKEYRLYDVLLQGKEAKKFKDNMISASLKFAVDSLKEIE